MEKHISVRCVSRLNLAQLCSVEEYFGFWPLGRRSTLDRGVAVPMFLSLVFTSCFLDIIVLLSPLGGLHMFGF